MSPRTITIMLTLFLGGLGIHRFYLNKVASGVMYFLFCWTFIPLLLSFFELLHYLWMSEHEFNVRYMKDRHIN